MRSMRTLFYALTVIALAACGGGGGSSPVPNGSGALDPNGSSVGFEKATLWAAYNPPGINAFPTDANGPVTPAKRLGSFQWPNHLTDTPGIVDIAIAPDGTQWILENRSWAEGGGGWRLFAVAPGDNQPENVYGDDVNVPFALGLAGDGVMVGYSDPSGTRKIATYPYASSNAPAMRTFVSTGALLGFAEGNDGHLYVARPTGVDVYDPASNGCCPIRTISIAVPSHVTISPQEFAVGPDNTIYIVDLPGNFSNPTMYVNVYPPGSGTAARRIGPLPANYNGLGFPVITVDSKNRLFVATQGQIYRFGAKANGTDAPLNVMSDATSGRVRALAVGPKL